ncbi:dnaJ homolog subfamily C member 7-like [Teleopsis dalmanni]|uniref:dnaJ homolog subfamily C member 7-like n=1 Tax=Teleopsis dalmanni TaxID=139649 RepID=UPI0018CDFB66|nr:dnaJ homolog subfamily C member 7-like [Teleopsis dalmanni]XP_037946995.1 dnaJ homolog subfamily C member 7-like [Teleopsis dalmanni]
MQEFQNLFEEVDDLIKEANTLSAEFLKSSGDRLYEDRDYKSALHDYNAVITEFSGLCQNLGSVYSNRSGCLLKLENCKSALGDALIALELDSNDAEAHINLVRCYITLGDISAAEEALETIYEKFGKNFRCIRELTSEFEKLRDIDTKLSSSLDAKDFKDTLEDLKCAMKCAPGCIRYRILHTECLAYMKQSDMAVRDAASVLHTDCNCSGAHYVTGLSSYFKSYQHMGVDRCKHVLLLSPEHKKSQQFVEKIQKLNELKERGNQVFMQYKFHEAIALYTQGLNLDKDDMTFSYKFLHNRALGYYNLRDYEKAIDDCTNALILRREYFKAYILRGRCYNKLGMYKDSVADFEAASKVCACREIRVLLCNAKFDLKCCSQLSYYSILGISESATQKDLKKAYKRLALLYHPDKHASSSVTKRSKAEQVFKEINKAYTTLIDPAQKLRYDQSFRDRKKIYTNEAEVLRKFFCNLPNFWNGGN